MVFIGFSRIFTFIGLLEFVGVLLTAQSITLPCMFEQRIETPGSKLWIKVAAKKKTPQFSESNELRVFLKAGLQKQEK